MDFFYRCVYFSWRHAIIFLIFFLPLWRGHIPGVTRTNQELKRETQSSVATLDLHQSPQVFSRILLPNMASAFAIGNDILDSGIRGNERVPRPVSMNPSDSFMLPNVADVSSFVVAGSMCVIRYWKKN